MAYTLEQFCADHRATPDLRATARPGAAADRGEASGPAEEPEFVAETFNDDTPIGRRTLHHDPGDRRLRAGACLRGPEEGNAAQPRRVVGGLRDRARGHDHDRVAARQFRRASRRGAGAGGALRLGPGETRAYGPGAIHSTAHPRKAWVVRVTGTDLDAIPRYRFKPERDRILEKA
jgi:hypothetical protein